MKILVSGMNSRQANPAVFEKDVTFSGLLAKALRAQGHEVDHRTPSLFETVEDYDHVFLGLAPLHALGANRVYGALNVLLRTWGTDKLSLFSDDPEIEKITGGITTMFNEPGRLVKGFYVYRLEYNEASQPAMAEWLQHGVRVLHEQQWPNLIVPTHVWANAEEMYAKKAPNAAGRIIGIDPTSWLPQHQSVPPAEPEVQRQWVTEAKPTDKWFKTQRPEMPVQHYTTAVKRPEGVEKRPFDKDLVGIYKSSWGVLAEPQKPVGWWTSRMGYAAQAGTPFVTRWQDVQALGDAYTQLPDAVAQMSPQAREMLAEAQAESLLRLIPDRETTAALLEAVLFKKEVAA